MHLLSPRNPTLILAAVFLILGAYLYFFELPDKNAREEAGLNETRVLDVTADSIETIIIRHPEEEIHLEKQGPEDWTIRRPLETEADAQEVRGLISTLVDLRHERIVEETGAEAAEFGLDHPFLEVVLESSDRSETIRIGDDAPVGGAVFLDRGSDGRVVTVQKWVQGALTRTAFDLREKTILSFTPERIDGIKLQFPEHTLTFEKKPDGWEVTDPVQAPGDPETFTALLNALQNLRADAFIDPGEAYDQTMTTLTTPLVEISLREGTRVHQARIFDSPDREKVQVLRAETDPVFGTPRFIMDSLQAEPFHYQDKHLVFFDPGQVLKVEVRGPLEQYTLTRGDGGWKLDGSDEAIHVHLADRLVDQIQKLEAFQQAEESSRNRLSSGLESAGHVLNLFGRDSQPLASIRIGNEWKGMLFALGRPALGEVMIDKDFLDEIPRKNELVSPKEDEPADSPPGEGENPPPHPAEGSLKP